MIHARPGVFRTVTTLLLGVLLTLSACTGGGAGGALLLPLAPLALNLPPAGTAPDGMINGMTSSSAMFEIELPTDSQPGDIIRVRFIDTSGNEVIVTTTGRTGGGMVAIGPADLSGLLDGAVTVRAEVERDGQTSPESDLGSVDLDTMPPLAPDSVSVPSINGVPDDVVATPNEGQIVVELGTSSSFVGDEHFQIQFTDGVNSVMIPLFGPATPGATSLTSPAASLETLADGPINVEVVVSDDAGNTSVVPYAITKDTVPPTLPVATGIAAGGGNVANEINVTNAGGAMLDVVWPTDADVNDSYTFTFSGGGVSVPFGPVSPIAGGGVETLGPIDLSGIPDGTVLLLVQGRDPGGNTASGSGTSSTKSSGGIVGPSSAEVAASADNAADTINQDSQGMVTVRVILPNAYDGSEQVSIRLGDGVNPDVASAPQTAPIGGGMVDFVGLDASGLNDGLVALTVVVDAGSGPVPFSGDDAQKDTVDPAAPTAAGIAAGPGNGANVVNAGNLTTAQIDVTLDPAIVGDETLRLRVIDGGATVLPFGPFTLNPGGGVVGFGPLDLSPLGDGPLNIEVIVEDPAGNEVTFNGTPATKSTTGPDAPTAAAVAAGASNGANEINQSNVGNTQVSVTLPASTQATHTVTVMLSDGVSTVSSAPTLSPGVPGAFTIGGIDSSSLQDGPVTVMVTIDNGTGGITGFTGTPATKDATGPMVPLAAFVAASTSNPQNFINFATQGAVRVDVFLDSSLTASDSVALTLSDSVTTIGPFTQNAPAGGGILSFTGIDASALTPGSVSLGLVLTDAGGNATNAGGTPAIKDVTAPDAPTATFVAAGASNPQDFVNNASQGSVSIEVQLPASYLGGEMVSIAINDGVNPLVTTLEMTAPAGPATMTFPGVDLSGLNDGPLTVVFQGRDGAGNAGSFNGTPATKDVVAPDAPNTLAIALGAQNAANIINEFNDPATILDVDWAGTSVGDETATVTITSAGGGSVPVAATPLASGGVTTIGPFVGTPLADGALTLSVEITDPAGNVGTFPGTPGLKDITEAPAPLSARVVAGPNNNQDFISALSQGGVQVDVQIDPTAEVTDSVTITLTDNMMVSVSGGPAQNPMAGGGTLSFTGIDASGLNDGPIAIAVRIVDANGNETDATGTPATKDIIAPNPATGANVAATANNPQDFINGTSAGAVSASATLPLTLAGDETVTFVFDDSVIAPITSSGFTAASGVALQTETGINLGALNDGAIAVTVIITDPAGNTTPFIGTPAQKDTVAPIAASGSDVPLGASNAINVVNDAIDDMTSISINWDISMAGDESVTLTVTSDGGAGMATLGPITPPLNGGPETIGPIDLSGLPDGNLTFAYVLTDPSGNETTFGASPAIKDATAPDDPTSAGVIAGVSNGANFINLTTESMVNVDVVMSGTADPLDQVTVTLDDGAGGMVGPTAGQNPTAGGTLNFTGINTTGLAEGAITVTVEITDPNGNTKTFVGTPAQKDITPPAAITAAAIPLGANNPADWINDTTKGGVNVDVGVPMAYESTHTLRVQLDDGGGNQTTFTSTQSPTGGVAETLNFTGIDANGLVDGSGHITITVEVTDAAGNQASFTGTAASKDTVLPDTPAALAVKSGAMNAVDVINANNVGTTVLTVTWGASQATDEVTTVEVTSAGGGTPASSASLMPSASGATEDYVGFDTSGVNDGAITLTMTITDPGGNERTFVGTPALKDVLAPDDPTVARVAMTVNNGQDIITAASEGGVQVDVTVPASAAATDAISVVLRDPTTATTLATATQNPTGGILETLTFTGIDASGLADGPIFVDVTLVDDNQNSKVFSGTNATKAVNPPAAATAANVVGVMGVNPADWINEDNQNGFTVAVQLPASYAGTEDVLLTISDGVNTLTAGPLNPSLGGGTLNFTGLDVTNATPGTLNDSLALTMAVQTTDVGTNVTNAPGFSAMKDTLDPDSPTALRVASGAQNAQDFINMNNDDSVVISVTWGGSQDTTDSAVVTVSSDGGGTADSAAENPSASGATDSLTSFDATALADSTASGVTVTILVTDVAGNTTSFTGTPATKDATPPGTPTAMIINAGASNDQDVINPTNETAVSIDLTFAAGTVATDTFIATLTDESMGTSSTSSANAPATSGAITLPTLNVSSGGDNLDDGDITLSVELTDANGNSAVYTFGTALKDTVDPDPVTAAVIPSDTDNNAGFAAVANAGSLTIEVTTPATYTGVETVSVVVTDGGTSTSASTQMASGGAETLTFSGIDLSGLNEGSITIEVDVDDDAGNSATQFTSGATKDTVAPDLQSVSIPFTISTPTNRILSDNEASVTLRTTWGANSDSADTYSVVLDDGSTQPSFGPTTASSGAGDRDQTGNDLSGLDDGIIDATATATDAAGNSTEVTAVFRKFTAGTVARKVFAVNRDDDTVTSYLFDNSAGSLFSTGFAVTGDGPVDLTISETEGVLYVANETDDNVSAFTIDVTNGVLTEVAGSPFAAGDGPVSLSTDVAGRFLYVANATDTNLSIYTITTGTGVLTPVGTESLGGAPTDVMVDPSGRFLYAATPGFVTSFVINQTTGALSGSNTVAVGTGDLALGAHPSGDWIYVTEEANDLVNAMDVDQTTGVISAIASGSAVATGDAPTSVTLSPDGLRAYVTNVTDETVSSYDVNGGTGALTATTGSPVSANASSAPVAVAVDAQTGWTILAGRDANALETFPLDGSGELGSGTSWPSHAAPTAIAFCHGETPVSFSLLNAYVAHQASGNVSQVSVNDGDGVLTPLGTELETVGSQPRAIVVNPTGTQAYVLNRGGDSISRRALNSGTGAMSGSNSTTVPTNVGGNPPRNPEAMVMSPTGRHLFVVSRDTAEVVPFSVDPSTGNLTAGTPVATTGTVPVKMAVSPSGKYVYVVEDNAFEVFQVDLATGALTSIDYENNFFSAANVAVHPSGKWVYLLTEFFGVKIFDVDSSDGTLTYQGGGSDAATGTAATSIAVSPDGAYAWVVNRGDQDVSSYTIDGATGALSTVGTASNAPIGADAREIFVDPLTRYVYVTDFASSAQGLVYLFDVTGTGELSPNATQTSQMLAGSGSDAIAFRIEVN